MKIIFPLLNLNKSGGTRVALQYCKELSNLKYKVQIITPESNLNSNQFPIPQGVAVKFLKTKYYKYFGYISLIFTFKNKIEKNDIIFATSWQAYLITILNFHSFNKTILLIQHDDDIILSNKLSFKRIIFRLVYRLPIKKLTVSDWLTKHIMLKYNVNSISISNGIDLNIFFKKRNTISNQHFEVMCVARNVEWKGLSDFIKACELVSKEIKNLRMNIVTSENINIKTELNYIIHRPKNDDELVDLYSSFNCFVFPSWIEGFGLPPLEAMACGIPVICTRCGGVDDFIIKDFNCIAVDIKNPQQIADGIKIIYENSDFANKLIQNGLITAQKFSIRNTIEKLDKIIIKLYI